MLIIATDVRSGRLGFLASPKFAAVVAVVGVLVAVLAYVNDLQGRNQSDGGGGTVDVTPAPTPGAGLTSSAPSPSPNASAESSGKVSGTSLFALSASPVDDRTVEVAVTPPAKLAVGQHYWFFVEVDWRDGNTDYYPREQLSGASQTLTITIPSDATLGADRTGRVYRLNPAQSAEADERLKRQRTSKDNDFFPDAVGAAASGSTKLPFGA